MRALSNSVLLGAIGLAVIVAAFAAVPAETAVTIGGPRPAAALTITLYASFSSPTGWGWTANNITEPGPTLAVHQGDVITFQLFSNDSMVHELIIDLDNSHTNTTGDAFSATFSSPTASITFVYTASTAGSFAYFCGIHGYNAQHGQLQVTAPPSVARNAAASAGNGQVVLSWTAPASNGASAITNYKVYRGTTAGGETVLTTLGNVTTYTDSAVTNGQIYYYQVSAVNGVGEGPKSTEVSATPGAPAAPADNTLLIAGAVVGIVVVLGIVVAATRMRKKKP